MEQFDFSELENIFRSMEDGRKLWLSLYLPILSKDFLREFKNYINNEEETKKIIIEQYGEKFYEEMFGRKY